MFVLEKIKEYACSNRMALINREETLSYRELDTRSEAFAAWLLQQFGTSREPIVIYGEKETNFLPCIFGALKAGRGYVPIDRSVPADRVAQIAEDVQPKVIIDFGGFNSLTNAAVLTSQTLAEILHTHRNAKIPPSSWISGNIPAYILFTSGSTGKPKGVPITSGNLTNFYRGLSPWFPQEEGGVILHQISYSFDVSGCAVFAGLSKGMTLFTIDHQMTQDIGLLFSYLGQSGLTMWVSTPSFAEICVQSKAFSSQLLPHLKQFLFCGEVLTHPLCDSLVARFPQAQVLNTYGPTEATVLVTAVEITEDMRRDNLPIPIGQPIEGTELRLEDEDGQTVTQDGQKGELLILGDSVSPGYFGRSDNHAFFQDAETGLAGYRTGDLCFRQNGLYYYIGRVDNQLKLNGFRIEAEDVENNLTKLSNIVRAAVIPVWRGEKVQYLAAFLLMKQPDGLSNLKRTIQIKKQLAEHLPAYMIPRNFFVVDAFPLGVSGKIDKKELARQLQEEGTS